MIISDPKTPTLYTMTSTSTAWSSSDQIGRIVNVDVRVYVHRAHPDAVIPQVAYGKTSAAFDLTCVETTVIPARGSAIVPNGLNLVIDEQDPYWMQIQLRSSKGFKYELVPHSGVVDAGYCGDLGVKIYNLGDKDVIIEKGERYAQITVHRKPEYQLEEIDDIQFEALKAKQNRGTNGFGSSGK